MQPLIRGGLGLLLEVLPVVGVGFLVFHLIRTQLLEYYEMRDKSKSMEPTLVGDNEHGDLVLVNKMAWWFKQPQVWDMVVVRGREGGNHVVKRMAARGPKDLRIKDGDLWQADPGSPGSAFRRVSKHPLDHADLRIGVFEYPYRQAPPSETLQDFFHMPPGLVSEAAGVLEIRCAAPDPQALATLLAAEARRRQRQEPSLDPFLEGHLSTRKPVDTSYLDPQGQRQWRDVNYLPDIGLELDLIPDAGVLGLQFVFEYREKDLAVTYGNSGRGRLLLDGEVLGEEFAGPELVPGQTVSLAFGHLDGQIFFSLGAELLLHRAVELSRKERCRQVNALHFGLAGGSVGVKRLRVFHDLAVLPVGGREGLDTGTYHLAAREMFLLGDNGHDSRDSRYLSPGNVRLGELVGRPFAVFAPASRRRVLLR